jgi:hypothetical protein
MVRIPKTGSTSVIKGLLGGIENAADNRIGEFPDDWRALYSFAFVRNPFDRLVSALLMFRDYPIQTAEEASFRDGLTLQRILDVIEDRSIAPGTDGYFPKLKLHALPMTAPLFMFDKVRDFYRFEDFTTAYRQLAERLGLDCGEVPHLRKTDRQDYRAYYSEADRARAEAVFGGDLARFGYRY